MTRATHPFRFGAVLESAAPAKEWAANARRIEDMGYSSLLVPDHFNDRFAPLPALMAAAAVTSTLRVGTMVADNDYRHPMVLAKDVATIDVLSEGRFELGIGAGWERQDYDWSGIPYDPAAVRLDRLEEAIDVIKGLWAGEPFSYKGEFYTITDHVGTPSCIQRPHPPLLIGGGGKRVLTIAARVADIVSINFTLDKGKFGPAAAATGTRATTAEKVQVVREAAGERFPDIELSCLVAATITDDREGVAARLTRDLGLGLPPEEVLASPYLVVGTVEEIVDTLLERREMFGFSYLAVALDSWPAMGPIIDRLAGT